MDRANHICVALFTIRIVSMCFPESENPEPEPPGQHCSRKKNSILTGSRLGKGGEEEGDR